MSSFYSANQFEYKRPVRSYVRREGRMTSGQQNAIKKLWPDYGIEFHPSPINLDNIFNRYAPRVLDIGTGMGESLVKLAISHPENDYLAVEVHKPGIGSLLRQIEENRLNNIRIINHDAVEVLKYQIPLNCLDSVHLFFPDPWPKKRHHKRRLVNPVFLTQLSGYLKENARLFIATDWQDYAEYILEILGQLKGYINLAGEGCYAPRPVWRRCTKFETRGNRLNYTVYDFVLAFRKQFPEVSYEYKFIR